MPISPDALKVCLNLSGKAHLDSELLKQVEEIVNGHKAVLPSHNWSPLIT